MAIAALSNSELNNNWMYAALRVQGDFNTAALALLPSAISAVHVLTPTLINEGEYVALSVLRKAINTSLAAGTYPVLTNASNSLTNIGWKYLLADIIKQANTSLATV